MRPASCPKSSSSGFTIKKIGRAVRRATTGERQLIWFFFYLSFRKMINSILLSECFYFFFFPLLQRGKRYNNNTDESSSCTGWFTEKKKKKGRAWWKSKMAPQAPIGHHLKLWIWWCPARPRDTETRVRGTRSRWTNKRAKTFYFISHRERNEMIFENKKVKPIFELRALNSRNIAGGMAKKCSARNGEKKKMFNWLIVRGQAYPTVFVTWTNSGSNHPLYLFPHFIITVYTYYIYTVYYTLDILLLFSLSFKMALSFLFTSEYSRKSARWVCCLNFLLFYVLLPSLAVFFYLSRLEIYNNVQHYTTSSFLSLFSVRNTFTELYSVFSGQEYFFLALVVIFLFYYGRRWQ